MFINPKVWKCATPGCNNLLSDQLKRSSYRKKFCDVCRKKRYLESRRKMPSSKEQKEIGIKKITGSEILFKKPGVLYTDRRRFSI